MPTNYESAVKSIRGELKKYLVETKLKSIVLGISGGIDSALCAALARPVCDELGMKLIGVSLPIETNKQDEIDRAAAVGKAFCHEFQYANLKSVYKEFVTFMRITVENSKPNKDKIRHGNVKARLRMIYLYDLAQERDGMVLSTDNWSEMLLGYFTIHGDHNDYGMIQYLWKTEVYELAKHVMLALGDKDIPANALMSCIVATPTDGLGITESDVEALGAESYEEVDKILKSYVIKKEKTYKDHPVIKRYEATHFKRNWPFSIPRDKIFKNES